MPVGITPHGAGVGILMSGNGCILCDSEPITSISDIPVAGLTYSQSDVPLVAWVPLYSPAAPMFASKSNRWHTESIPGPAGIGGLDIETDTAGQVFIVYSTQDSGLWCARGEDVVGVKESRQPQALSRKLEPTVVRSLPSGAVAFDAMGRRVANPKSGIYFVRDEGRGAGGAGRTRKVVVQR